MSATIPRRARRRWTYPCLWALLALGGCSNGVVEPIVGPITVDGGDRDGSLDAGVAFDEGPDRRDTLRCDDPGWAESATSNEGMLLGALNVLRRRPPELCVAEGAWGLRSIEELRCVAWLGANQRTVADGADQTQDPPSFVHNEDELDIHDREERAGIRGGTVRLELLIMNAETVDEIFDQLLTAPGDACRVFDPAWQFVGIAQREDFWTLDFARGGGRRP